MTEHTKTDGLPGLESPGLPPLAERARPRNERMNTAKVECNACPVLCQISEGRAGACDRYANQGGTLVRLDPVVLLRRTLEAGETALVPFAGRGEDGASPSASLKPSLESSLESVAELDSELDDSSSTRAGRRARHSLRVVVVRGATTAVE